jgi:pyruvate,water dikinase
LSEQELLEVYDKLYAVNLQLAYHNILVPLSMSVYNGMLSRHLHKNEVDPLDFDLGQDLDELRTLDPKIALNDLKQMFNALSIEVRENLANYQIEPVDPSPELKSFLSEFEDFIDLFGHFSESGNDFSSVPWREDPLHVIEMIQRYSSQTGSKKIGLQEIDLGIFSMWVLRFWVKRTRRYLLERERVSSTYTYGYGLFRDLFLRLGEKFVARGVIKSKEEIFMLTLDEVKGIISSDVIETSYQDKVDRRLEEMEVAKGIILPEIFYGDEAPPIEAFSKDLSTLHGMPTSRGYYEGKVTVIQSLSEKAKLKKGDVLVVPYSDVAWTPLFGLAGAVIAQSGGVLSHSSIVAREMGIPCVVSVANACKLEDGTNVVVDGHRGEITIKEPGI